MKSTRRFYLICKKSFWGKLSPIGGSFNYNQALEQSKAFSGKTVILRFTDETQAFEREWDTKPEE